jgi:hypothetical protein
VLVLTLSDDHPSQIPTTMSSNILPAPVTEFAFITLKEGKESERGDLERSLAELQEKVSAAEGFHASSWGQSVDPGKENVYVFVLGWDTTAVECLSHKRIFISLTILILAGSLASCRTRDNLRQTGGSVETYRGYRFDTCSH